MKTCLYQPIFINPQAYFVFPSLYHIEKGDSFIEPANITGQLIINTLTDDPTLTPIILTVKDNNQVDFSIFAGKHIRISQYTDEGAVVLGEWLMPGESAPVYPDWFTSSVKAIYDPAKQGMTNYDVIEAYVEDFTNWNYVKARGVATISQHKFIITECILKGLGIVEDIQEPYSNLTVRIIGITDNQEVLITDCVNGQHQIINTITEDGIYTIEDRHHFVGFGCNFVGTCNITIEQLPTSILKDLSGNGNHAYLYGGKGKLNSGMGLYKVDFTSWRKSSVQTEVKPDVVKVTPNTSNYLFIQYANSVEISSYKIKVIGLGDNVLKYQYATENGRKEINIVEGENELPTSIKVSNDYQIGYRLTPGTSVFTITQIPDYPDQLCYDGKMYAVCYGFPILTDYTVMAERTWFEKEEYSAFISNSLGGMEDPSNGAFSVELKSLNSFTTISFGSITSIGIPEKGITYQTKQSYNGNSINVGTKESNDILILGGRYFYKNDNAAGNTWTGCHGTIIVADRSFTEEEINWIKENIYNIKI